jgi:hypothetical protein
MAATAAIENQTTPARLARGSRLGALAGFAFALSFFVGVAMLEIPRGATDAELVAWWSDSGNRFTAVVSMYLFVLAGLCFLVFLIKLRSRLLAAEGGAGELTALVVASGGVFVAILFVAAAARGVIAIAAVLVACAALAAVFAIPALLIWTAAVSTALWRQAN